jgi:hypothetical protein
LICQASATFTHYIWADGIHLEAPLEDEKQCILVLIGATPKGKKELVGFVDGGKARMIGAVCCLT